MADPISLITGILGAASAAKTLFSKNKGALPDESSTNQGGETGQADATDWANLGVQALQAGQGIASAVSSKKAKDLEPPSTNPAQTAMLADISRRRRAYESGNMASPYLRPLRQAQAQATAGALRTGAGLRGISAAQRTAQQGMLGALGQQQQLALGLGKQEMELGNYVAQRKLDLQRVQQTKQEARAASLGQSAVANMLAQANLGREETEDGTSTTTTPNLSLRTGYQKPTSITGGVSYDPMQSYRDSKRRQFGQQWTPKQFGQFPR